jgi:hypothetical protein
MKSKSAATAAAKLKSAKTMQLTIATFVSVVVIHLTSGLPLGEEVSARGVEKAAELPLTKTNQNLVRHHKDVRARRSVTTERCPPPRNIREMFQSINSNVSITMWN